jgi:hypothetical protein
LVDVDGKIYMEVGAGYYTILYSMCKDEKEIVEPVV